MSEEYHVTIILVSSFIAIVLAFVLLLPWIRKNLPSADYKNTPLLQDDDTSVVEKNPMHNKIRDTHMSSELADPNDGVSIEAKDTLFCFRVLLILNAALESFAHGANGKIHI